MTVHIGEITSEVLATDAGPARGEAAAGPAEESIWAQRCRIDAVLGRLATDRARTATGHGDD